MANIVTRTDNQLQANGGKALDAKMQPVESIDVLKNALNDSTNKTSPFYQTNVYIGMVVVVTNPVYEYDEENEEDVLVSTNPIEYIYTEKGWVEKKAGVDSTEDIKKLQEELAAESSARKTLEERIEVVESASTTADDTIDNLTEAIKAQAEDIENAIVYAEAIVASARTDANDALAKAIETEIKERDAADATTLQSAKEYADGLADNYDAAGAAATAEQNAKNYADGLADNYDAKGAADTALASAKEYADGLADNYDAKGAADTAEQNAKTYADGLADNYDAKGAADTALASAKEYADGLADNYDAKGAADTALASAKEYAEEYANTIVNSAITDTNDALNALAGEIEELKSNEINFEEGKGIDISGETISSNAEGETTADITIQDGAISAAGIWENDVIPAGTSVQEILTKLLSTEKWSANPSVTSYFNATLNPLSLSMSQSNGATVEVGTPVTIYRVEGAGSNASQSYTVKTMEYGYSLNGKDNYTSDKSYSETLTPTLSVDTKHMLETFSGFVDADGYDVENVEKDDSLDEIVVYAQEGSNTVNIFETGCTYASEEAKSKDFYIATNMKNYTKSKTDDSDNIYTSNPSFAETKTATGKASATVTGAYKYYYGFAPIGLANTLANLKDDDIYNMSSGWTVADGTTVLVENNSANAVTAKGNIVIAVPAEYMLRTINEKLSGSSLVNKFATEIRDLKIGGESTKEYRVYYYSFASAPTYYNVTITAALA